MTRGYFLKKLELINKRIKQQIYNPIEVLSNQDLFKINLKS